MEYTRNGNDTTEYTPKGNRFEKKEIFRKSLSRYSLSSQKYLGSKGGGIPLYWDDMSDVVYVDSSDAHSLIIGSTGSKKSRLIAMPMVKLLGYAEESMIISDPKAEIYNRTAGELKANGYEVMIINLRNPWQGNAWNPLAIPYRFYCEGSIDKACEFVNDIATNLMLSERHTKDPYWDYSASNLFFGLAMLLFVYCDEHEYSFNDVNIGNLLRLRNRMFSEGSDAQSSKLWKYALKHEIITSSLMGTVIAPDKTQACILSTFDEKMRCFSIQPSLIRMLSNSDISLESIGNQKTAVFIIMPDEKTSYHKLVSLFIKQSYEYLINMAYAMKNNQMEVRVNYVLDEFSSLPQIGDFPTMITAARSRNIRFNLIVQSKHQLLERYGNETETIQSNCTNWIFLTSREIKLLEEVSALCGTKENGKPLMPIYELQRFDKNKGEALVLSGRLRPYKSCLLDIEGYDNNVFHPLDFLTRKDNETALLQFDFDENIRPKTEYADEDSEKKNEIDLQAELERKFEELFGPLSKDEPKE